MVSRLSAGCLEKIKRYRVISKPPILDLMFRRALFWLDLEILVFACVSMTSWLATPTFFLFFHFLVFYLLGLGMETVHWNCGGKLVSSYGQLQSGPDILLYEIVSYTTIILTLYFLADFVFFFFICP